MLILGAPFFHRHLQWFSYTQCDHQHSKALLKLRSQFPIVSEGWEGIYRIKTQTTYSLTWTSTFPVIPGGRSYAVSCVSISSLSPPSLSSRGEGNINLSSLFPEWFSKSVRLTMGRQAELPPGQTASLKFPTVLGILSSGAIWQTAEWAGSKPRKDFSQTRSWPHPGSGAMERCSFEVRFSNPWKIQTFPFLPVASSSCSPTSKKKRHTEKSNCASWPFPLQVEREWIRDIWVTFPWKDSS